MQSSTLTPLNAGFVAISGPAVQLLRMSGCARIATHTSRQIGTLPAGVTVQMARTMGHYSRPTFQAGFFISVGQGGKAKWVGRTFGEAMGPTAAPAPPPWAWGAVPPSPSRNREHPIACCGPQGDSRSH